MVSIHNDDNYNNDGNNYHNSDDCPDLLTMQCYAVIRAVSAVGLSKLLQHCSVVFEVT